MAKKLLFWISVLILFISSIGLLHSGQNIAATWSTEAFLFVSAIGLWAPVVFKKQRGVL